MMQTTKTSGKRLPLWRGNRILTAFTLGCILVSAHAHSAQETLSWEELKALAGEYNPALRSSLKSWQASQAGVRESYGDFLPEISLSARRSRTETEVSLLETTDKNRSFSVAASWNIFNGFATVANVKRARAVRSEAEAQRDLTSAELRYQLRRAFFRVFVQQQRIDLFEKILKRQKQNETLISLKYNNGTEARWNLLKTQAERERAEYNLETAKADLLAARDQLASLIHADTLPDQPIEASPDTHLNASVSLDLKRANLHPELLVSQFSEQRVGVDRILARSAFLPVIDLTYSQNRAQDLTGARTRTDSKAFEITARWNVFNGLSDFFNVQQANIAYEAALLNRESLERRIITDIRASYTSLLTARLRIPTVKSLRQAAEERVRTVSAQYRSGLKSYLEWEQAETQLIETEQLEITALSDALLALAEFEKASGVTLEEQ